MAELHLANIRSWRHDKYASQSFDAGEMDGNRHRTKQRRFLLKRFSRNPDIGKAGRSSSVLKESKSNSIMISMLDFTSR
jgi:hypothetical protein